MDQLPDALFLGDTCHAAGAFFLNAIELLLAAFLHDADAIHHRVRARDRPADRSVVADVGKYRLDLSDHTVRANENRFVRTAHGDADAPALLGHPAGDIPAYKAGAAKDRDEFRGLGHD